MTKRKKTFLIAGVLLLLVGGCCGPFVYTLLLRAQCGAESIIVQTEIRGFYHVVLKRVENTNEIPQTYHLMINDDLFFYPTITRPRCGSERLSRYSFGDLNCADILAGKVPRERIEATATDLSTASRSWEFITGLWMTRELDVLRIRESRVIGSFARLRRALDQDFVIVTFADGHVEHFRMDAPDVLVEAFGQDRLARAELGLAPFPPEFESWLLTGEPASVENGTFVPPRLDKGSD